jgi:hypothetical protein
MDKREAAHRMLTCQRESCHIEWHRHCSNLAKEIISGDLDNFMDFQAVRETMFVGNAEYTFDELAEMKDKIDLEELKDCDKFSKNFQHPEFPTTGNNIHHRYHIYTFEHITQKKVKNFDNILELGGGYGNMARLIHRMGFDGCYSIDDLPEFCTLQEYYLDHHKVKVNWHPNLKDHYDLFIATWSLSEIPIANRGVYQDIDADHFLIAFGPNYGGIDNMAYFRRFSDIYPGHSWMMLEAPYLPNQYYLIGVRR